MRAHILADRHRRARSRRRASLGFPNCGERQSSERGKTTGGKSGAAQKAAAIDGIISLMPESRGERSASRLTMGSFDQHELLTSLRRIVVDAIERLHFGCVSLIVRPAFVGETFGLSRAACGCNCTCRCRGSSDREQPKDFAATDFRFGVIIHFLVSLRSERHSSQPLSRRHKAE
jgi:hypothetical protein